MTDFPFTALYPMVPLRDKRTQKNDADPAVRASLPYTIHPTGQDRLRQHPTPLPSKDGSVYLASSQRQLYISPSINRPTLIYYLALSLCLHLLPFALFFLKIEPAGSPSLEDNESPMTMLFASGPASRAGMKGDTGNNENFDSKKAAGSSAPLAPDTPPTPLKPSPQPDEEPSKPQEPTPLQHKQDVHDKPVPLNAPPIKIDQGPARSSEKMTKKKPEPPSLRPVLPRPSHRAHKPHHFTPPHVVSGNDSPLNHPENYSFGENDSGESAHSHKGKRHGRHAPIDMSIGPLVQNGQFKNSFSSTLTAKGATSSYYGLLGKWLRMHLNYYPEDAAERGEEGNPIVEMDIEADGTVNNLKLIHSSGSDSLDSALLSVFRTRKLPPIPPNSPEKHVKITVSMHYNIIRQ